MTNLNPKSIRVSCRHASQLLVKRADARLTLAERLKLAWHLRLCPPCTRFARQVRLLNQLLTRNTTGELIRSAPTMRPERRAAMAKEIEKRLNA